MSAEYSIPLAAKIVGAKTKPPSPNEQRTLQLFDQFQIPLQRYLRSLGLASDDAEEIVQEVFMALFQHLQAERPQDNMAGWLFRVAHNIGLKRRKLNADRERIIVSTPDPLLDSYIHPSHDPEQSLASDRRRNRLLSVVRALPERDRHCLYLRAEGLRYREIAKVLEISLGAVAQSLSRSISRLTIADLD